ncbi:helix-turn-helix domain-containing protein [Enterococcus lactis]|uniref:helix-turn-helix domain-containing protein n=1 Tax=Enterococcus lactis TaxID=357441 RepID=UPI0039A40C06
MSEDITMLEKLSERQLRLAMLLSMDSFYLEDLAKKIAVTKKTLLSDIAAFNFVHSPASIHIDEQQKVSLRLPCEYNLESITSTILKHSSHIQLLKIILMQEPCIAKLADQLFLSTASIRRIIMFLNESFQKRGFLFRIHTTPYVHIQGEERQIRFFTAVYLRRSIHRINFLIPKYCLQLSNDT